ncbi:MAG: hypothetical protein C4335_01225 [Armatimonadota bacterium]
MRICVLFALAAGLSATAMCQEEVIRIPGEVRFASAMMQRMVYYGQPLTLSQKPPAGVQLPEWVGKGCRFGTIKLGKPVQQWHFVLHPEALRAVVDTNRNNDLTDDVVLVGMTPETYAQTYAPVRLTVSLNGTLCSRYFRIQHSGERAYLFSEDYRVFNGTVAGQPFQMAAVDANADGAFDTPSRTRWDGDRCLLSSVSWEQDMPIPRLYLVGDRYYRLKVAPDGSVCELHPSEITMATVKTNYTHVRLTLMGKTVGFWEAQTSDGVLQLPADEYTVSEYSVLVKDAKGVEWDLQVSTRDEMALKVGGSKEASLSLPDGLVASLSFGSRVKRDTLDIALVLQPVGQRFQQVTALRRGGELPSPPSLRIVDRRGRTVRVEKFHYG